MAHNRLASELMAKIHAYANVNNPDVAKEVGRATEIYQALCKLENERDQAVIALAKVVAEVHRESLEALADG